MNSFATIVAISGPLAGRSFPVGNQGLVIGRDQNCEVCMHDVNGISRNHCHISYNENSQMFVLQDLGSSYGTFTSVGQKYPANSPVEISPNEEFYVATPENRFVVKVQVVNEAPQMNVNTNSKATIVAISGPLAGRSFPVGNQGLVIGRDQNCEVCMHDVNGISRNHCRISYNENSQMFVLQDLGSSFGTFTSAGQKCPENVPIEFSLNSEIYLAVPEYKFKFINSATYIAPQNVQDFEKNSYSHKEQQPDKNKKKSIFIISAVIIAVLVVLVTVLLLFGQGNRADSSKYNYWKYVDAYAPILPDDQFNYAMELWEDKEYERSIDWLILSAKQGDEDAVFFLAEISYDKGNYDDAWKMYQYADELGHSDAKDRMDDMKDKNKDGKDREEINDDEFIGEIGGNILEEYL